VSDNEDCEAESHASTMTLQN